MESDKRPMGKASIRPNAKIIAAFLCLPLILASLAMVSTHLYAARMNPDQVIKWSRTSTMTVTVTTTATATPTNTPTPTPTETPTPTPTEVPTNTPTPEPTATATPTPAPTATTAATATPTAPATATAKVGATSTPTQAATTAPTQTTNPTQSPTALPWGPTSTTNGSGNGGEPTAQSGSSIGILSTFAPFIIGALIFTGVVGALLLALVLLRKRLMPLQPLSPKLPPSGAPPWRRTRIESLQGTPTPAVPSLASNAALAPNANSFPQPQPALFSSAPGGFPSQAAPFPGTSIGFPPPQPAIFPYNANAFPPGSPVNVSDQQFQGSSDPPTSGVLTANKPDRPGSSEPVTEQMKTIKKPGTRLVKLEKSETPPDR